MKRAELLIKLTQKMLRSSAVNQGSVLRKKAAPLEILSGVDIGLTEEGVSSCELSELVDKTIEYSVNTDNALFMNQMYGKQQPIGVLGDMLTAQLNTSMYTYEVAPVMTMIEKECISRLATFVWGKQHTGDGVFTPGSSISNMKAMMLARNAKFPEVGHDGLFDVPRFSIFISDQAHYSFLKGAMFMGFGKEAIVTVKSDAQGRMDLVALNAAIIKERQLGKTPMMLVGVAGTTFAGKYDDLQALGAISKKHSMWFHVDGAYGGSLMFSHKEKHRLQGIDMTDSYAISLHKMMGLPLVCAALLTKETGVLNEAFSVNADYLFHDNDDFDLGQKSLQCGRRVDALKLWLAWKDQGDKGFEARVDAIMDRSRTFAAKIQARKDLELLCQPESGIICFRFQSQQLSNDEQNVLNKGIRQRLFDAGQILFNYATHKNDIYLRCVISDPDMTENQLDEILNAVSKTGNSILSAYSQPELVRA